jgi:hypothetical protein
MQMDLGCQAHLQALKNPMVDCACAWRMEQNVSFAQVT